MGARMLPLQSAQFHCLRLKRKEKAQAEKIRLNASQLQFGLPYDIEKKGSARFRKPDKET